MKKISKKTSFLKSGALGAIGFGLGTFAALEIIFFLAKIFPWIIRPYEPYAYIFAGLVAGLIGSFAISLRFKNTKHRLAFIVTSAFAFSLGYFLLFLGFLDSRSPNILMALLMGYFSAVQMGFVLKNKIDAVFIGAITGLGYMVGAIVLNLIYWNYFLFQPTAEAIYSTLSFSDSVPLQLTFLSVMGGMAFGSAMEYFSGKEK